MKVPGEASYRAIEGLEAKHPDPDYRRWMAVCARERAIADADEPLWTAAQVYEFCHAG